MSASIASLWQLRSRERVAFAAAVAAAVFAASWGALHVGFYDRDQVVDTPVYQRYGEAMADGRVPYRDFELEYPAGALPVFVVPALGRAQPLDAGEYRAAFEWLMLACGLAAVVFVALTLAAVGAEPPRVVAALAFVGLAPLALGSVVLTRFDLWPAALTAGALAALALGRGRLGFGVLGLGAAAKLYPGVLLPLAVAYTWRRAGRREAIVCSAVFFAILAALVLPFVVVAPEGVWHAISRQLGRPLQIESVGSALLLAAHHLFGFEVTMRSSSGSQNLVGSWPEAFAVVQSLAQAAAVVGVWVWFARGRAHDAEDLLRASALAVCAFIALGKVLSSQFLIWLIPLVPLVRGRRGLAASALLALALVLTQLWFPYRYWDLALRFDETASWLVLARDVVLIALLAVLVWPWPSHRNGVATR